MLGVQMVLGCIDVMGEYLIRHHKVLTTLVKLTEKLGMQKFNVVMRCGSQGYAPLRSPFNKELAIQVQGTHLTDSIQWQIKVLGNSNSALIYHVVHNI